MKPKLVKPTDRELDEAVAQYVAGWRREYGEWRSPEKTAAIEQTGICTDDLEYPPFYSTRVNVIWPLLESHHWIAHSNGMTGSTHGYPHCSVKVKNSAGNWYEADWFSGDSIAQSFPRAICIALLRAHGVEVET